VKRQPAAFIEKLINLDDKKQYFIVTCGEEVHFAYNRVAYVSERALHPSNANGTDSHSLTEYFEHRNVGQYHNGAQ
jgi:nitrite reductase (NAD(P)H)